MISVVEPEGKLVEVQWQVLGRNLVEYAHDPTLEQRPGVLNAVDVDVPVNVGLGVIDRLMSKLRAIQPAVGAKLVGMDFGSFPGMGADEIGQRVGGDVLNRLKADAA